jgi:hypothetical protein
MFIVDMGLPSYNLGARARFNQRAGACNDFLGGRRRRIKTAPTPVPAPAPVQHQNPSPAITCRLDVADAVMADTVSWYTSFVTVTCANGMTG